MWVGCRPKTCKQAMPWPRRKAVCSFANYAISKTRLAFTTFHNELRDIIDNRSSLGEFNRGNTELVDRWQIPSDVVPSLLLER